MTSGTFFSSLEYFYIAFNRLIIKVSDLCVSFLMLCLIFNGKTKSLFIPGKPGSINDLHVGFDLSYSS